MNRLKVIGLAVLYCSIFLGGGYFLTLVVSLLGCQFGFDGGTLACQTAELLIRVPLMIFGG